MRAHATVARACGILLALAVSTAHAGIEVRAAAIAAPGLQAQDVQLSLAPITGQPGVFAVQLTAASLRVPALGWHKVAVHVDGTLQRQSDGRWILQAPLQLVGAPGRALRAAQLAITLDPASDTAVMRLSQGPTRVNAALPMDLPLHVQLQMTALPLNWLSGVLASASPGASIRNGIATGTLALDDSKAVLRVSGRLGIEGLAAFARGGSVAAQGFGLRGDVDLRHDPTGTRLRFDGALRGGELLAGSFYAQLPARDTALNLGLTRAANGALRIGTLRYQDPGAVSLDADLSMNAAGTLTQAHVRSANLNLATAIPRYASTWLQSHGLAGLQGLGEVHLAMDWQEGLRALDAQLQHVDLADTAGRFAVAGLDGAIDWRAGATLPPTALGWRAASIYRVPLGLAHLQLADQRGRLALVDPVAIPMLGGRLRVQHLAMDPSVTRRTRLSTGLAFTGISLGELSGALGWPAFRGTLGGAIPDLRLQAGRVELQGGLSMQLFGGHVDVTRMSVGHLFGVAPELGADLTLRNIELAPLTGVFDFGEITGKLDGSIQGLRLVDWRPVAFAADLHTAGGGRISQRALNNITSVGGGGMVGGIQGALLRVFSSFSYSHIGLSCTLANDVCTMGGVGPADGGGYTIVAGSGLPYIHIIGHQRQVDWDTLVSRLKAATAGQRPVIR